MASFIHHLITSYSQTMHQAQLNPIHALATLTMMEQDNAFA